MLGTTSKFQKCISRRNLKLLYTQYYFLYIGIEILKIFTLLGFIS